MAHFIRPVRGGGLAARLIPIKTERPEAKIAKQTVIQYEQSINEEQKSRHLQQRKMSDRIDIIQKAAMTGDLAKAERGLKMRPENMEDDLAIRIRMRNFDEYKKKFDIVNTEIQKRIAEAEFQLSRGINEFMPDLVYQSKNIIGNIMTHSPRQEYEKLSEEQIIEQNKSRVQILLNELNDTSNQQSLIDLEKWVMEQQSQLPLMEKRIMGMEETNIQIEQEVQITADEVSKMLSQANQDKDLMWEKWSKLQFLMKKLKNEHDLQTQERQILLQRLKRERDERRRKQKEYKDALKLDEVDEELAKIAQMMRGESGGLDLTGGDEATRLRAVMKTLESSMSKMKSNLKKKEEENGRAREILKSQLRSLEKQLEDQQKAATNFEKLLARSKDQNIKQEKEAQEGIEAREQVIQELQDHLRAMTQHIEDPEQYPLTQELIQRNKQFVGRSMQQFENEQSDNDDTNDKQKKKKRNKRKKIKIKIKKEEQNDSDIQLQKTEDGQEFIDNENNEDLEEEEQREEEEAEEDDNIGKYFNDQTNDDEEWEDWNLGITQPGDGDGNEDGQQKGKTLFELLAEDPETSNFTVQNNPDEQYRKERKEFFDQWKQRREDIRDWDQILEQKKKL
ncbi:MAG: hypothetical protein EZS28_001700 [Streblomastix strix]|uniref:Uncharacterized protein n=1 Tax=Streblomastix strix TaxID=222440 RepID=A0A5J4X842_9EUKA|nr:MAG: hypothetical protein EZS28_001700 [Streblomastix strix]